MTKVRDRPRPTSYLKGLVKQSIRKAGYDIRAFVSSTANEDRQMFDSRADDIYAEHDLQDRESAVAIALLHKEPVMGWIRVWDLLLLLAQVVDPTDKELYNCNQLFHCLQTVEGLQSEGYDEEDLILIALIHDIGKAALLAGTPPSQLLGRYRLLAPAKSGTGLDNCFFHHTHGPFLYDRIKDLVPDHVSWTIRHHSLELDRFSYLMDKRDRTYAERYLTPFVRIDNFSKSVFRMPRHSAEDYRSLIDKFFPDPILF